VPTTPAVTRKDLLTDDYFRKNDFQFISFLSDSSEGIEWAYDGWQNA
jgi:hypothetical protein